eukprot:m.238136 g.238136  ORF g.238136 m.238136 type:complete len:66 (-) comp15804_c0_seq1:492-689(-)
MCCLPTVAHRDQRLCRSVARSSLLVVVVAMLISLLSPILNHGIGLRVRCFWPFRHPDLTSRHCDV